MSKLDSLQSYAILRGCREGCPAAPIKFNILHHVATTATEKIDRTGLGKKVCIDTYSKEQIWPQTGGIPRTQVAKLGPERAVTRSFLDVVGYADDTTIVNSGGN